MTVQEEHQVIVTNCCSYKKYSNDNNKEKHIDSTLKLVLKLKFSAAAVFIYSPATMTNYHCRTKPTLQTCPQSTESMYITCVHC